MIKNHDVRVRVTKDQYNPLIYDNKIVWQDYRNNRQWDIYLYDLSTNTERRITTDLTDQTRPYIHGNKIVWEDARNRYNGSLYRVDIYMYDLSTNTERQITANTATQADPVIYENKIVWRDTRNGELNSDIYMEVVS